MARHPGLAAEQVQHTLRMLAVAVAQIEFLLRESESSVNTLTRSFTRMIGQLDAAARSGQPDDLARDLESLHDETVRCVMSFQFFDKMAQRLHHVKEGLQALADLIADPDQLSRDDAWQALQAEIRRRYTMPEERAMFDAILAGASVDDALNRYLQSLGRQQEASPGNDIELF